MNTALKAFTSIIVGLLLALLMSVALILYSPVSEMNRLFFGTILVVPIYVGLIVWVFGTKKIARLTTLYIALIVVLIPIDYLGVTGG